MDSFILHPKEHLKNDGTPYKVFTAFFKSLEIITSSKTIETFKTNNHLKKVDFEYDKFPSLKEIGFEKQILPKFLNKNIDELLGEFITKLDKYQKNRDLFFFLMLLQNYLFI